MTAAIALVGVHFRYESAGVLSDFNLTVARRQVVALLGPSGSGKSTVLRVILGLAPPQLGTVLLGGEVVSEPGRILVPPERRQLSVVFRDLALWPHMTVRGNLGFGLAARGVPRVERASRVAAMLDRLGLADKADRYPGHLSGGKRQRVAIGRALVQEPRAILLDEPLSNLDVTLKSQLLLLVRDLLQEYRSTAIYVTHEPREAVSLTDRIAVMEAGRIVQVGTLDQLRAKPASTVVRNVVEDLHWAAPARA